MSRVAIGNGNYSYICLHNINITSIQDDNIFLYCQYVVTGYYGIGWDGSDIQDCDTYKECTKQNGTVCYNQNKCECMWIIQTNLLINISPRCKTIGNPTTLGFYFESKYYFYIQDFIN